MIVIVIIPGTLAPFLCHGVYSSFVCSVLLDSVSSQRERGGRGGGGRKEKKSGCFISIDTIII